MRAAILHLAFAGLGAEHAVSSAFADNPASLGYVDNGWYVDDREGQPVRHLRLLLGRDAWLSQRRDDIEIIGLDRCLPLLGIAS